MVASVRNATVCITFTAFKGNLQIETSLFKFSCLHLEHPQEKLVIETFNVHNAEQKFS